MSFIVFYYVGKRKEDKGTELSIAIISCLFIFMFLLRGNIIIKPNYQSVLSSKDIEAVLQEQPKRLYNMYDYGGDLIYHDIPVFIDGRADLYSRYHYKDYLNLSKLEGDYVSLMQKYDFDYLLVDKGYPIATYLKYNEEYELIYQRKKVLFYKKRTT